MATTNYITGLNGTDNTTYYLNEGVDTRFFRGTCNTAKGTATKTAILDDNTNFSLTTGVKVAITFINGSDVNSTPATLNVNSTGAKTVIVTDISNTAMNSTSVLANYDDTDIFAPVMLCQPYEVMFFVYNGTNWVQTGTSAAANLVALHHSWLNADRLDIIGGSNNIINVQHGGTGMTTSGNVNAVVIGNSTTATSAMQTVATDNGAFYATAANAKPQFGTLPVLQGGTGLTTATNKNAVVIGNGTTANGAMQTVRTGNGAFYATAQDGAPQFGTLPVQQGGTGLTTATTVNAVVIGNSTTANNALQTVATASGAFYATSTNGKPQFGTLPVAQGGTGATSFTANSVIISGSSTTSALTTRSITNNTTNTAITNNNTNIPTMNTIYYGLVAVNGNSQSRATTIYVPTTVGSNNQYLKSTGSGGPSWQSPQDSSSASAISSSGTNLVTERDIYYGLPTINNSHAYTSSTTIYAPTAGGTEGQILSSSGSGAPTWVDSSTVGSKIQIVRW